jgi:hypothetical protein
MTASASCAAARTRISESRVRASSARGKGSRPAIDSAVLDIPEVQQAHIRRTDSGNQ